MEKVDFILNRKVIWSNGRETVFAIVDQKGLGSSFSTSRVRSGDLKILENAEKKHF